MSPSPPTLQSLKWALNAPSLTASHPQVLTFMQRTRSPCAHCPHLPPQRVTQTLRGLRGTPKAASGATHLLTSLTAPR